MAWRNYQIKVKVRVEATDETTTDGIEYKTTIVRNVVAASLGIDDLDIDVTFGPYDECEDYR